MKQTTAIACILLFIAGMAYSQAFNDSEPPPGLLRAPFYPGAVYIRTLQNSLDPYHTTAEYITSDSQDTVVKFFERKLPDKREVTYEDKETYLVAFLMKTWSKMPGTPKKSDLNILRKEPTIEVREYDPGKYGTLMEYFSRRPDGKAKVRALDDGHTLIRYTYRREMEELSGKMIMGVWRDTDRDMPRFYGSVIEFLPDDTYTFRFTAANLQARGKSDTAYMETGKYAVLENVISFESNNPLDGTGNRNGIITIGGASLSIELVGKPRMTFLRMNPHEGRFHRGERDDRQRMKAPE